MEEKRTINWRSRDALLFIFHISALFRLVQHQMIGLYRLSTLGLISWSKTVLENASCSVWMQLIQQLWDMHYYISCNDTNYTSSIALPFHRWSSIALILWTVPQTLQEESVWFSGAHELRKTLRWALKTVFPLAVTVMPQSPSLCPTVTQCRIRYLKD